jgi:hypothetical protein
MRPFQEFRYWTKRAPAGERTATGVAALIVLVLLAWLLVPEGDDTAEEVSALGGTAAAGSEDAASGSTTDTVAPGATAGGEATTTDGGTTAGGGTTSAGSGGTTSGGTTSGGGGTAAATGGDDGGCKSPPGSAPGITATEVKVIVVLTEIVGPAANSLFDVPTPAQAKADFDAAIAGINKEGGVACRKLVARYVNVNPVDEAGMIQRCREFAGADAFAIVDTGSMATRPAVLACLGQSKVPYFGAFYITETLRQQFYPYLYSFYYKEQVYKDTAFALRDFGYYDPAKGFKKLGFIYRDCEKEAIESFKGWIREASGGDFLQYSVGCPAVFANEADIAQAVLTFQRQGVTHVITGNMQGDVARLTSVAEQQGFRPKWGFPDEAMLSIASGSRAPNPQNIAGAFAVTQGREAENKTPGMTPTAGTQRCNAYRAAAKLRPVYDVPANAGHSCDQLWMLQAALSNAPELSRTAIQVGLQRAKSIDFSFPQGPTDFTAPKTTTGGQFYRVAQFTPECSCWRLIQRDFKKGF